MNTICRFCDSRSPFTHEVKYFTRAKISAPGSIKDRARFSISNQ